MILAGERSGAAVREAYHAELRRLSSELQVLCGRTATAMERATQALLCSGLAQAEQVIVDDVESDRLHARFERAACSVIARQAPVAGELRAVVGMIQVAEKVVRMGDLARHVAEAARRRHPYPAVPEPLTGRVAEMGALGVSIGRRVEVAVAAPGRVCLGELEQLDDSVDRLEAEVLAWVAGADTNSCVRTGVEVALLGRYFERYADQGVAAARRLNFMATGERSRAHLATT
jgi:phosphate transport system protein